WFAEEAGCFGPRWFIEYEAAISVEQTGKEVAFLEQALGLNRGMRILDVPSGHGRHSIEFAKRGYTVVGVDINNFFLEQAQSEAENHKISASFLHADMRKLNFQNEFDLAVNLFTSLGYFDDESDDRKIFDGVY